MEPQIRVQDLFTCFLFVYLAFAGQIFSGILFYHLFLMLFINKKAHSTEQEKEEEFIRQYA
jgi:hypothetical protein